jgi:hypothetical protein
MYRCTYTEIHVFIYIHIYIYIYIYIYLIHVGSRETLVQAKSRKTITRTGENIHISSSTFRVCRFLLCEQDCQNGIVLEEIRGSAKSCSHSLCKHKHTPEDASAKCVRCAAAALAQIQNRLTPKAVQRQAAACVVLAQHSPNTSSAARLKVSCFHGLSVLHKRQDMHRRRCLQDPSLK